MKKIQNNMKGKFIKVLNEEHGKKVIEFFKSKVVDTGFLKGDVVGWYYGVDSDGYFDYFLHLPEYAELIELPNEPLKKMTKEEIEKELGYKIKIVS